MCRYTTLSGAFEWCRTYRWPLCSQVGGRDAAVQRTAQQSSALTTTKMASFNTRLCELMMHQCAATSVQLVPLHLNVASTQSRATGKAADGGGGGGATA